MRADRPEVALLQPLNQVQVGEHAMVSEDASLGVGRHEDGADGLDTGGIGGHELFPERALTGMQIETIHLCWQFSRLINVERSAVGAEGDRLFPRIQSRNDARLATARHWKEISLLIGTDCSHRL